MEPADKKNESEVKVNEEVPQDHVNGIVFSNMDNIIRLEMRIRALEEHLRSLDHGNEQGNDVRDGGWFD